MYSLHVDYYGVLIFISGQEFEMYVIVRFCFVLFFLFGFSFFFFETGSLNGIVFSGGSPGVCCAYAVHGSEQQNWNTSLALQQTTIRNINFCDDMTCMSKWRHFKHFFSSNFNRKLLGFFKYNYLFVSVLASARILT